MAESDDLSSLSFGLLPISNISAESTSWAGTLANGVGAIGNGPTLPAPTDTPASAQAKTALLAPPNTLTQLNDLIGGSGNLVPTSGGYVDTGALINSGISAVLSKNHFINNDIRTKISGDTTTYTGVDLKLLIDCAAIGQPTSFKQLIECHTISVTSYRMKSTVRANGYTNPKGFARGGRTIAGTIILTEMGVDALLTFLQTVVVSDNSKDSQFTKTDQLPPFNITMVFANEEGFASARRIMGVEFLNDGTVYSVQDLLTERTISWMAADFTPLLPLDMSQVYVQGENPLSKHQTTPLDLMTPAPLSNNLAPDPMQIYQSPTVTYSPPKTSTWTKILNIL
jgi:hypothetical protein